MRLQSPDGSQQEELVEALIIRIGFWGPFYYNYLGRYITTTLQEDIQAESRQPRSQLEHLDPDTSYLTTTMMVVLSVVSSSLALMTTGGMLKHRTVATPTTTNTIPVVTAR